MTWGWAIAGFFIAWLALIAVSMAFAWCCCKVADIADAASDEAYAANLRGDE
jgi:hypothetical protein